MDRRRGPKCETAGSIAQAPPRSVFRTSRSACLVPLCPGTDGFLHAMFCCPLGMRSSRQDMFFALCGDRGPSSTQWIRNLFSLKNFFMKVNDSAWIMLIQANKSALRQFLTHISCPAVPNHKLSSLKDSLTRKYATTSLMLVLRRVSESASLRLNLRT